MSTTPILSLKEKRGSRFGNLLNFDKWGKAPISHPALEAFDVVSQASGWCCNSENVQVFGPQGPVFLSSDLDYTLTSRKVSGQGWKASGLWKKKIPRKPVPSSQECSIFLLSNLGASIQFKVSIWRQVKTHWGDAGLNFATHLAQTVCCLQRILQVSVRNIELINSSQRNELQNDGWLASMRLNCLQLLCVLHVWNQ